MKNKIIKISTVMIATTLLFNSGCKKYLDQVPNDRITIDQVFQKKGPSEQYLANVYSYVDDLSDTWNGTPWEGNTDEIDITWSKYNNYSLNMGNISPTNALFDRWGYYYKGIRSATYFINHIDGNKEIIALNGQQLIDQYKAEARFLRAYYYFLLMRQYGPVVLVGETEIPVDIPSAEMQFPRSTYDECVNYVVSELDKAAAVLPRVPSSNGQASNNEFGRATVGMALAVKSRLLLYAASPEFNGNTDFASFKNKDGKVLINQTYDQQKWKKAADAAKAVIDLGLYNLYKDAGGDPLKSYQGIFFEQWNAEQIFDRKSNNLPGFDTNSMPRQAGGWNGIGVTQEAVDAYFMNDGKTISESPLYTETGFTTVNNVKVYNMYVNREPRFYASVTYNNAVFQGGNMTAAAPISFFFLGGSGKNGHATDFTKTGYLIRKNVGTQTNDGSGGNGRKQTRTLVLFRLGEIYLNYAEALNEFSPGNADILKYLNLIRERAGIPQYGSANLAIPASQADMRTRIWQERRVELAFESHRWFDIRRWKIAPQVMGDVHGMDVNKNDDTFYKRVVASTHIFRAPASYFFPIRQYEMDRSKDVVQNPGW
ncbi:RagB/SusD family nutrient uptake outer membrane protein [Pedobacter soli]|uniref:Starch-binding associating with outer membrane n=1 Tax=Pedobacter soli TaxID=390242 RepID=A0A1G6ZI20_9SPHI|nr:RagB/SusD family nutrient uptake outer membrane protein [Pedobacter soli]SDE02151.1 Starch-binding associating with outer membrane [Pedobacter soli]